MFSNNYISTIVDYQLPDFIRADHPTFVTLLKKYYEYMETNGKTLYENKRLYDYFDVDQTRQDLVKYFKSKIIPNFPEESELSTEKLVKAARDFYTKKGTPDSFKFLFRVLYGQEVEVYFPKEDILRASDGKWQLPQALRLAISDTLTIVPGGTVNVTIANANTVSANGINLSNTLITANSLIRVGTEKRKVVSVNTLGDYLTVTIPFATSSNNASNTQIYDSTKLFIVTPSAYENFNFNLIERRQGYGSESRATCTIESAVKSVDKETGREIVEVYISNLRKPLTVNEQLVVDYVDENGLSKTFSSKIISLISNINLKRNRLGVVQSGSRYQTGDPVVFYGGLNTESPEAVKGVATVQNVTSGAIKTVLLNKRGYYFRQHANSLVQIVSDSGSGANVIITNIFLDGVNQVANALANVVYTYDVTNSGSSAYTIGGNNNPTIYLYRGIDYTFNVAATGHPFWIQKVDAGYDASNVYSEGITNNGTQTGNLKFSVPMNAPDNLYYVCQYHSSMRGTITMLTLPSSGTSNTDVFKFATDSIFAKQTVQLDQANYGFDNVNYANVNTQIGVALSYDTFTMGKIRLIDLVKRGGGFISVPTFEAESVYNTDYSIDNGFLRIPTGEFSNYNKANLSIQLRSSNSSYSTANDYYTGARLFVDTGVNQHYVDIVDYVVEDVALPSMTKTLYLARPFENSVNPINIQTYRLYMDFRANVKDNGRIGVIEILDGGSGYHATDKLQLVGTGYGAKAAITVVGGKIVDLSLIDRGEGYFEPPTCVVLNSSGTASNGTGAVFRVTGLSDGEELAAEVTALGAIESFNLINRGYDYNEAPILSLKVADIYSDNLFSTLGFAPVVAGDKVWQGNDASNEDATFNATVDEIYRISTNSNAGIIRVFDYSGSLINNLPIRINTASLNVTVNVLTQNAAISFNNINPAIERQYPYFYGDGLAKANAEFLNGLIKYDGFYLNTDGHISSDKKIQDGEYYHNFSYEIQSEKSLNDYKETVERVAHPAGMQLWSKYLIRDEIDEIITTSSNVHISNTAQTTNCRSAFNSLLVTGNNSNFINTANVGDLIVINSDDTAPLRTYVKVITSIDPVLDRLTIESPPGGLGDGFIRTQVGNNKAVIYGNTYPLHLSLKDGDRLYFPNLPSGTTKQIATGGVSTTSNVIQFTTATNLITANQQYTYAREFNWVPYKIIKFNG